MSEVSVLLGVEMVKRELRSGEVAIVIDVIRASTTIIAALRMGAESVIPTSSIKEAFKLKGGLRNVLLSGERGGRKIRGFHLDNSPSEVSSSNLRGKRLVITTTHGTRLLKTAMEKTDKVLVGGLINRAACSRFAYELAEMSKSDIKVVIPRSTIGVCIEDLYAAGLIIEFLKDQGVNRRGDLAEIAVIMAKNDIEEMRRIIEKSTSATIVRYIGHKDDVEYCLKLDEVDLTPISKDGELKIATT